MTEGNLFVKMNKWCFGRGVARRVLTQAPLRPAATSPCEGEERKRTIRDQIYKPSGCSPSQGELPEGVRGGIDYERIKIAEGAAAPVLFSAARVDGDGVLSVDFEKNSGMTRAKGSDRVYIYIYNTDTREGLLSAPAERRSGRLQMQLPDGWNELNTRMWGFTVDKEGRASNSAYIAYGTEAAEPRIEDEMENFFVENVERSGSKSVDEKIFSYDNLLIPSPPHIKNFEM